MCMKQEDLEKIILEIHGKVCKIEASTEAQNKTLYGNGQPGLKQRFDVLETQCDECKNRQKKHFAILVASIALLTPLVTYVFRVVFGI